MRTFLRILKAPFAYANKLFILIFLNGFLLALIAYFFTEDNYERQIFKALALQVYQSTHSSDTDSILKSSLHLTYDLEQYRLNVFGDKNITSIKSDLIRPVTFDLMTGSGACGSYSYVLSRLLNELGIETRFAQMKTGNEYGGHIIVEAHTSKGWIVMDPSYDLMFKKPTGGFASFNDIKGHWDDYKSQVPANYNPLYAYEDVRYTNWDKYPLVMSAVKGAVVLFKGEKAANEFSIRNLFLRKFNFLLKVTGVVYIFACFLLIRTYRKQYNEIKNFKLSLLFPKKTVSRVEMPQVA